MIPGETEQLIANRYDEEAYDNFLFFGNKAKRKERRAQRKARRSTRRAARRNRPRRRFGDTLVGQTISQLGGAKGIGETIDTFTGNSRPTATLTKVSSNDYDFNVGKSDDNPKKGLPITVYIVGGVLVLGTAIMLLTRKPVSS